MAHDTGTKKRGGFAAAFKGCLVAAFDRGEEGTPVEVETFPLLVSQARFEECMTNVRDLLLYPQDRVGDLLGLDQGGDRGFAVNFAHLHGPKTRVNA